MMALGSVHPRAESRPDSGVVLALLELASELGDDPNAGAAWVPAREGWCGAPAPADDPSRSSAWLESLHRGWSEPDDEAPRARTTRTGGQLGRYRLIERLGQGSQAEVWRAIRSDPTLAMVALKVLPSDLARDPVRRARFHREAELGARLASPALLPTDDFGEADGALFLAMPLVDGGSLGDVIARRRQGPAGPPPASGDPWSRLSGAAYTGAVVRVLARVARALALVHASGVAHRDIKPANILLDGRGDGRAFLCDFGLGRDLDASPSPPPCRGDDGAGTPLYMAPERLLGRDADEVRCDVYSLGVTLFEAVTLVHPLPVPATLPRSCLPAYLIGASPLRPRDAAPGIPRSLEAIILKAMERDPARRYASVADLADDLERSLAVAPGGWLLPLRSRTPGAPRRRHGAPSARPVVLDGLPRTAYKEPHHLRPRAADPIAAETAPHVLPPTRHRG